MKLRLCISEHQLKPAARCFAWWVFAAGGMLFGRQGLSWDRKIIPKGFLLFSTILRMICCDGLKPRISLFVHISTLFQKYVILYFALNGWWLQWWFRWPDAGRAVGFLFWGMQKSFHWDHCNKSRKKKVYMGTHVSENRSWSICLVVVECFLRGKMSYEARHHADLLENRLHLIAMAFSRLDPVLI
jgi:hypothetical protein